MVVVPSTARRARSPETTRGRLFCRAVPALLGLIATFAGCAASAPPFPAGTVSIGGEVLPLSAPAGIEAATPADDAQRARWATAWSQRPDDPLASWARARLELLSAHPVASAAVALLEGGAIDETQRCARDADLVLARWLAGRPGAAIGLQGCAAQTETGRQTLDALLLHTGLQRAGRGAEVPAEIDPLRLFRRGPRLLVGAWDASTSEERDAAVAELRTLSDRHAALFDVPAAADWWQPLLGRPDDDPRSRAVRELLSIPTGAPASQAEAAERGGRLAEVAASAGDAGHGLIAARALHLRAWALEVARADGALEAWYEVVDAAAPWPAVATAALDSVASLEARESGRPAVAASALNRGIALAERHHLTDHRVRLSARRWGLERRLALSPIEVEQLLALVGQPSESLAPLTRAYLVHELGQAARRAGWRPLAAAACADELANPPKEGERCFSTDCLAIAADFERDPAERERRLLDLIELAAECGWRAKGVARRCALASHYLRVGDREGAEREFAAATAMAEQAGPLWSTLIPGSRLSDPEAGDDVLDVFDAAMTSLDVSDSNPDFRGILTEAYSDLMGTRLGRGEGAAELLAYVARRDGVRWFGGEHRELATSADLWTVQVLPEEGLAVALVGGPEPLLRRRQLQQHGAVLLDACAAEGAAWVSQGAIPRPGGPLQLLAELLGPADLAGASRPLIMVGTAAEASVPAALLPVGGQPLGLSRATALAAPVDAGSPRWSTGVLIAPHAHGEPFPGLDELRSSAAADGWRSADVGSLDELAERVRGQDVVHFTAHGDATTRGQSYLAFGPGEQEALSAEVLRSLPLQPGALVALSACQGAGGSLGDVPMDLPMAALQAGAGAVLYSRFPVRSGLIHEALGELYGAMPMACADLAQRWHSIRVGYGRELLGVEVVLTAGCLPGG